MHARDFEMVVRRLARRRRANDEWPLGGSVYTVVPSRRTPRQVLFATKQLGLLGVHLTELARTHTTCVFHYGMTCAAEWARLRSERRLGASALAFVGDLDPLDLVAFASLVAGAAVHGLRLAHIGVDDEWVRLCQRYRLATSPTSVPTLPTIKMSPFELTTYRELGALRDGLPANVGSDSRALLDAGLKLEIEGASNPAFYRAGFTIALTRMLRRRLATAI